MYLKLADDYYLWWRTDGNVKDRIGQIRHNLSLNGGFAIQTGLSVWNQTHGNEARDQRSHLTVRLFEFETFEVIDVQVCLCSVGLLAHTLHRNDSACKWPSTRWFPLDLSATKVLIFLPKLSNGPVEGGLSWSGRKTTKELPRLNFLSLLLALKSG